MQGTQLWCTKDISEVDKELIFSKQLIALINHIQTFLVLFITKIKLEMKKYVNHARHYLQKIKIFLAKQ